MRASEFNKYHHVLQTYNDLVGMVAFRYGAQAQGLVFVLYDQLIALRHILATDQSAYVVRAWSQDIADRLAQRYLEQPVEPAPGHPTAMVGRDPVVIEYSRELFERKYRQVVPIVQAECVELTGPSLGTLVPGKPYMYVIDDQERFLVWTRRFSFEELVFGRSRATVNGVPVAHPMLVPDRLRAVAAGEIVLIGASDVRAVIVNNKSGHFRFPPSCETVLRRRCREVFGLTDHDIDIFVVGGNAEGLVERSLVLA